MARLAARPVTPGSPMAGTAVTVSQVTKTMGTVFSLRATASGAARDRMQCAMSEVSAWLQEVNDRFTTHCPSEWLRYCSGEISGDDAHPDIRLVAGECRRLTNLTDGDFSITANPARPADPSAFVKGWAIGRAAELVLLRGADSVFVNGGGDIVVSRRETPWRLGIQHPEHRDQVIAVIELTAGAVATSGTYERGRHVYDTRSGAPAEPFASVTVTGPDAGRADAFSTAIFGAGERALDWFGRQDGYAAHILRHDGSAIVTDGLRLAGRDRAGTPAAATPLN